MIFLLLGALGAYNRADIGRLEGEVRVLEAKFDAQRDAAQAQAEARGRMAAQHEQILGLLQEEKKARLEPNH